MKLLITYVHHSCFKVETEDLCLVFDYYKGDLNLPKDKKLYFLASHSHPDHFSSNIFKYENVTKFILSDDIINMNYPDTIFVKADSAINMEDFTLYTFGSTDEGVSFVVDLNEKKIFHSGDLNDWYWEMEDSIEQKNLMHKNFVKEIEKIEKHDIDVAFFPVDPRQKGQYDLGGRQVLERLKPKHFFPCHFWKKYPITHKFKDRYKDLYKKTILHTIDEINQKFEINI